MEDLETKSYVDRLPVITTGDGISHLLAVPKIAPGTGEAQFNCSQNMFGRMGSNQPSWSLVFRHDSVKHGLQSRCMCAD